MCDEWNPSGGSAGVFGFRTSLGTPFTMVPPRLFRTLSHCTLSKLYTLHSYYQCALPSVHLAVLECGLWVDMGGTEQTGQAHTSSHRRGRAGGDGEGGYYGLQRDLRMVGSRRRKFYFKACALLMNRGGRKGGGQYSVYRRILWLLRTLGFQK